MSFKPPAELKYIRIPGHAYQRTGKHPNGAPFNKDGTEASGDYGYGKCECGVLSPKAFLAKADRNRWHFTHKVALLDQIQDDFEKGKSSEQQDHGQGKA